jgi:MFS transporter, DHA2 family, multidrug resistance protein
MYFLGDLVIINDMTKTTHVLRSAQVTAKPPKPVTGLAVLCLGVVMIVADNTIVNVGLPTLVRELGASTSELQWVVDSYVLAFASFLLPFGSLGDRFGRRRTFLIGTVLFAIASASAAFAPSIGWLIVFRIVMGAAAALIYPSTLALVSQLFPDPHQRKGAIAAWAAASGVAIIIGPIAGGWLLERFWWGSMFLVNVPIGIGALIIGKLVLPESEAVVRPFDVAGSVLSPLGVGAMVWGLIEAPNYGWLSLETLIAAIVSALFLGAFVIAEQRSKHPLLPLEFFSHKEFRGGVLAMGLANGCLFGFVFVATQFLQLVLGYRPFEAGVHYLPFALALIVCAAIAPLLAQRLAPRTVILIGMGLISLAMLLVSMVTVTAHFVGVLLLIIVLLGSGMGLTASVATETIVRPLPPEHLGVGSAVNDTSRELGGALGIAAFGSVFAGAYRNDALKQVMAQLPNNAAALVRSSPTAAMSVADALGPKGAAIRPVVQQAVTDGMHRAGIVAGLACIVGMVLVAVVWWPESKTVNVLSSVPDAEFDGIVQS